jgi:MoaA/NifB/PqqE/SkfB family radical SAM enzyme
MFSFDELYKIEIELTTKCQASCPMCSRNFHGAVLNKNVIKLEWTLADFKKIINQEVLDTIKVLSFCGSYGDPLLCKDLLDILLYVKENSNAEVRINTNGSLHTPGWWKRLATVLPSHIVVFGIDGFKGTHEKYRIGTNFDTIVKNAKAFIDAGGNAVGQFINFKHNEHEYEDLKLFLTNLGFESVFKINPDRFRKDQFSVLDKNKNKLYNLEPTNNRVVSFKDNDIINIINNQDNILINCRSIKQREIYIDAYKHLYPCCETAVIRYEIERLDEDNFNTILPLLKTQITQIHQTYNTLDYIDLTNNSIKNVLNDSSYLDTWKQYWKLKQSFVCSAVCGSLNNQRLLDRDSQFLF